MSEAPLARLGEFGRGRRFTAVMAALSLLVLFAVQGTSWRGLRERFVRDLASAPGTCGPLRLCSVRKADGSRHWSSTALSIVLQGRAPARVAMSEGCEELARTSAFRIAPWDLRERDGWFVLPR